MEKLFIIPCTILTGKKRYPLRKKYTMRHDKLERELELLLLLTENRSYTVEQICDKLNMSRRNVYYYLEFLRDTGFKMEKYGGCWSIDRSSPFFGKLIERVSFTEEEAITIRRLLNNVEKSNALVETLKRKIDKFYDFEILADDKVSERAAHNISVLHDAIKWQRQAVLRGYSSPHSKTERDRLVEPFMLMDGNREVRCYEPASGLNKTFKIVRMKDVDILADEWRFRDKHRKMFTDVFMFSGDKTMRVELILGQLAHNIMIEEYPKAANYMEQKDKTHWLLQLEVCSYIGIGRFVLGLFDDIEIIGDEGFKEYLYNKVQSYGNRIMR